MKTKLTITLLLLLLVQFTYATDYYISSSSGNDNNNGISPSTPWQTLAKVQNSNFLPGDRILLKKGDIWNETFKINSNGTISLPIIVRSYGAGNNPIIDVTEIHTNLTWTSLGNNIWSTADVSYNPKRLIIDGVEVLDAAYGREIELGTNIPDLVQWYYDNDTNILKIYSTDSPSNHNLKFSSKPWALNLSNDHNISIENIEFIGGYVYCIAISSCSGIKLTNLKVGKYAGSGLLMGAYKVNGVNFQLCNNVIIDNCNIDTDYTFDYSQVGTASGVSNRGPREGVLFRGTINCELKNSIVKNYCHANINIFAPATERGGPQLDERVVQNCEIYNNTITSPDIAYGGRIAIDGYCSENEIYNNLFVDISVQNQFNGFNNHIHHNIFKDIKNTPLKPYTTGNAIGLQGYYIATYGNVFENNLMINCESNGIFISGNNSYGDVTNNIFRNNIIYNCGTADNNIGIRVATDFNSYSNHGNIFQNNLIFCNNTDQTIDFYNTIMNITSFNVNNNTNYYTISNNLNNDPLFIDTVNEDFHLQNNSPCIDSGITPTASFDRDGNPIPFPGTLPDIGIYEFQNPLNISENSFINQLDLFPNPIIDNNLFIKSNANEIIKTITIYNSIGYLISSEKVETPNNHYLLNLSNLNQGIYIINIKTDLNNYSNKIIKKQ